MGHPTDIMSPIENRNHNTGSHTPSSHDSKPEDQQLEYTSVSLAREHNINTPLFDAASTKRLLRKMDIRLLPFLALLYLLSFLDRTNIGNARLFGLEADLGMSGLDYNIALSVFFPTYVLAEIPSNILLKKLTPAVWLTTIMMAWGIIVIGMGFVTNFKSLVACRALLGLAEGGLFPGVSYYITLWYPRHECGLRLALFFSAATAAGAFGGLLAAGIGEMEGLANLDGWSWIFILEGILTIFVAFFAYPVIINSPETARFLTEEEKAEVQRRLVFDRGNLADEFDIAYFWDAIKDWKIYVHMLCTLGLYAPLYSFSLFLPTIIRNMGYSRTNAQFLSVPPYAMACVVTICVGFMADKYKRRGIFMMMCSITALCGWIMLISTTKTGVQYTGTFLACSGIYPLVPLGVAWNGNNIGGSLKRGVGIAMHVGAGNLGGILASFIYLPKDSPEFTQGHAILIGTISMSLMLQIFMWWYLKSENARRDEWAAANNMFPENYTQEQRVAERRKGDNASFFRYTL